MVTNLFQKGVHRGNHLIVFVKNFSVPVYDVDASLYAILSQSDIAAFVWSKMADPNEKSLSELVRFPCVGNACSLPRHWES